MKIYLKGCIGNMAYSKFIRFWGVLDVCYVLWVIYADLTSGRIPFFGYFVEAMDASSGFDLLPITMATIVGSLVNLTVIVSGILMLMLRKQGVYISLFQAPFRLFLIISPTLFFISKITDNFSIAGWFVLGIIAAVELFKVATEVMWLRKTRKSRVQAP